MNSTRVTRDSIQFEFIPIHTRVETSAADDRLFLDCGNSLGPGVIDHHHLSAYSGSTAGLIARHPELVSDSIRKDRRAGDPFVIVLHDQPDLDCVVSASLALSILSDGDLPAAANALANYVDRVDAGHSGFSQQHPYSLYAAYLLLVHDLAGKRQPDWVSCLRQGMKIVEHVLQRVSADGLSIWDVDAFECDQVFRPRDRKEMELDLARYRNKLADPSKGCRQLRLKLPGEFGGHREVDGLFARDVQNIDDPERCVYFKDWARTDQQNSRDGNGFVALSVFVSESAEGDMAAKRQPGNDEVGFQQVRRCIVSVAPGHGVTLRGLGKLLDQAESGKRIELHGLDNRVTDLATIEPLTPRFGYSNADPWYDGRGHNYTIIDSPRNGTVLTAEQIENIFIEFGANSSQAEAPRWLSPDRNEPSVSNFNSEQKPQAELGKEKVLVADSATIDLAINNSATMDLPTIDSPTINSPTIDSPTTNSPTIGKPSIFDGPTMAAGEVGTAAKLSQMSAMVENWKRHQPGTRKQPPAPDVFISYPHLCQEWVEAQVAQPLAQSRGTEFVFFDKSHLQSGMSWLTILADNVMSCRLFIPIYCQPYFQSDFCQWELQLALTRDPTGRKRIIVPFQLEPMELPAYCRLIQAQLTTGNDFTDRLLKLVNEILD